LYGEPIYAGDRIVGAINIGYGNPPKEADQLKELSKAFGIDVEQLNEKAISYDSRPNLLLTLAKKRLRTSANLIGEIVEKAEAQKKLKRSMALLDETGSLARVGGWELDAETLKVTWTKETYRIHEVPLDYQPHLEEAINFFHPEDRESLSQAIQSALKDGKPFDMEIRFITAKGNHLWTHTKCKPEIENGKIILLNGIFHDITERKHIEEALRKSEIRFHTLFENISDAIYVHDAKGRFFDVNHVAHERLGYTREEILKLTAADIDIDYPTELSVLKKIAPAITTGPLTTESRHKTKDGRAIHVELKISAFQDYGKELFATIARDITKRKQAEAVMLESEKKYRLISENMADIITTMDMNLRFTYVSPSIMRLRGYTVKEALAQTIDQTMTPDSFQLVANAFEEELRLEETATADPDRIRIFELEEYKKDGSTIWVENTSSFIRDEGQKPIGILIVSRDITERKRNKEQRDKLISNLQKALGEVKTLSGLLPICSYCKKIRDDKGYWKQIESYIHEHSEAEFSHGICQECAKVHFPDLDIYDEDETQG